MALPVRIFLLEDDAELCLALESVLTLEGYHVISAADGAEAVERAAESDFDIFVFDIKLPGPDGLEVLAQFKKESPELLSVVMTGYATERDTLRALRLGVGDYLKKPFPSAVLLEAIRRLEPEVHRRRRAEQRERGVRRLSIWSLEFLVGGLELSVELPGLPLVESGRVARRLALGLGYAAEAADELQAAVLLKLLEKWGEDGTRWRSLLELLPDSVLALFDSINSAEGDRGLAGLGAKCALLPERLETLRELEEMAGAPLGNRLVRQDQERRQLLSLGRTLMASSQPGAASVAFRRLAGNSRSAEAGRAWVELSRLAWTAGDLEAASANLCQVSELLPELGPQMAAELELDAGLAALGMGLGSGQELLHSSQQKLAKMNLPGLLALASLADRLTQRRDDPLTPELMEALESLHNETGALDRLLSHSWWMLAPLLDLQVQQGSASLQRLLSRLVRDATRAVSQVLQGELATAPLMLLLDLVQEAGASPFLPSLQTLFSRSESRSLKRRIEGIISGLTAQDSPTLRLYSLGPFEVWIGDHRLPDKAWRTHRSRFLLACLAARRGRPLLAETVIEQFWPGIAPEAGKKNLSQTLSDARKTLWEGGFQPATEIFARKHNMIALSDELPVWHDVEPFRAELERGQRAAREGQPRQAHQHLRQAYALLRGDYLEDCAMDWALDARREFDRLAMVGCEGLARICRELGLFPEMMEAAHRVLDRDPCYQALHLLLMDAYLVAKRPDLALRQFEKARVALEVELGVEPSMDLLRAGQKAKMAL